MLADSLFTVVSVLALAGAALHLAAVTAEGLGPRLLSAAVFAAAAAVLESLGLGLLGLGGTPGALCAGAGLTWLLARALLTAPPRGPWFRTPPSAQPQGLDGARRDARGAVHAARLRPAALVGLGALTGVLLAAAAAQLHRPLLGQDAITYHLAEVVGWVQDGHPGRVLTEFYGLPVGNYPLTQEVLLTWVTGLSHGFGAALLLTLASAPLLLLAGWVGLAQLGVPAPVRVLALAALALVPLVLAGFVEPGTDVEALAWLLTCAALCLAARAQPALLAPAVLAAGLGAGTKTTVITWALVILAATVWFSRGTLARPHRPGLILAVACSVLTGGVWYLRNWVDHGSPLWPFSSFPGADPRPRLISYLSTSLLASVHRTLLVHLHPYAAALSGGTVLIFAGVLIGVFALALRRRRPALAGLVVLLGSLEYAAGPVTGLPAGGTLLVAVIGSTLRYLMPVFAAGACALALAASERSRPVLSGLGGLGLIGAVAWDVVSDVPEHFALASAGWLWIGLLLGGLAGAAAALVRGRGWTRPASPRTPSSPVASPAPSAVASPPALPAAARRPLRTGAAVLLLGAAAVLVLAESSHHFSYRHAVTRDFGQGVDAFLVSRPGYLDTRVPVATTGTGLATLAGDRLEHPLSLIPADASCAQVRAALRRGWVVLQLTPAAARHGVLARVLVQGTAGGCLVRGRVAPVYDDGTYAVFAPLKPARNVS